MTISRNDFVLLDKASDIRAAQIRRKNFMISAATGVLLVCVVTVLAGRHVAEVDGLTHKIVMVVSGAGALGFVALLVLATNLISVFRLTRK